MESLNREFGYSCKCGKILKTSNSMYKHGKKCKIYQESEDCFKKELENQYILESELNGKIKCILCNYWGHKLKEHIERVHDIDVILYKEIHGEVISEKSKNNYSEKNKINGNWINRKKENGEDLTEYREKMGKRVSESILSNSIERKRRSELFSSLNKTEVFRKNASETAKITSSRKDILEKRTENLLRWISENYDEFLEKCTGKMLQAKKKWKQTKPEKWLMDWLEENYPKEFNYSRTLKNKKLKNKSKRKQIDFVNQDRTIFIEVDGIFHFKKIHDIYENICYNDTVINEYFQQRKNKILIRISYDQWHPKTGKIKEKCLNKIKEIIFNSKGGVYFLGEKYGKNNIL